MQAHLNFYGRRKGRALRPARAQALDQLLPQLKVTPDFLTQPLWLDIGFGDGALLAAWVKEFPDTHFLGCEPFVNGVAALMKTLQTPPGNLRVHMDVVQSLLPALPDACCTRVTLINPDPWPKKRHHGRRFVQKESLDDLARILQPGGEFFTCTDHPDLFAHMRDCVQDHRAFVMPAQDHPTPPDWWAPTRYAQKDLAESGQMFFLVAHKVNHGGHRG